MERCALQRSREKQMGEQKGRKPEGKRNGSKTRSNEKEGNTCHILPGFGVSFPNSPQSPKTFSLVSDSVTHSLQVPQEV